MSGDERSETLKVTSVRPRRIINPPTRYPETERIDRTSTRPESIATMVNEDTVATPLGAPRVEGRLNNAGQTNINVRSVADTIPYFKGNLLNKDSQFGDASNPVTLKVWLDALEAYFKTEGITSDRDKKSRLLHYVDRKAGDAHSIVSMFLCKEYRDATYEQVVNELRQLYKDSDTEDFYTAVREAMKIQLGMKESAIPRNTTDMYRAAKRQVNSYLNRKKYNSISDARAMEDILFEFAYFQMMCINLKPKVFSHLIDKEDETGNPRNLRSKLGALMHKAPVDFGEPLVIPPRVDKVSFAQEQNGIRERSVSRGEHIHRRNASPAPSRTPGRVRDKSQDRCFSCNRKGHYSSDCRVKNRAYSRERYDNSQRGRGNFRRGGKRQ